MLITGLGLLPSLPALFLYESKIFIDYNDYEGGAGTHVITKALRDYGLPFAHESLDDAGSVVSSSVWV
jgi:hypothetical protein